MNESLEARPRWEQAAIGWIIIFLALLPVFIFGEGERVGASITLAIFCASGGVVGTLIGQPFRTRRKERQAVRRLER